MSEEKSKLRNIFESVVDSDPVEPGQEFLSEVEDDPDYYNKMIEIEDETNAVYSTYPSGVTGLAIVNQTPNPESEPAPTTGEILPITGYVLRAGKRLEFERDNRMAA